MFLLSFRPSNRDFPFASMLFGAKHPAAQSSAQTGWVFRKFCHARTGSFTAKANFICAQCSCDRSSNRSATGLRELDRRRSFDPFGSDELAFTCVAVSVDFVLR